MKRANIFVANGSDDILNFAFMAFAGGRTEVMFRKFPTVLSRLCQLHGLRYREVPLKDDFSVDPADYVCQNKMIVIANPNAPTGRR